MTRPGLGAGPSENAINKHMIDHVENVLNEDIEAKAFKNDVVQKLATITKSEHEKSEGELDDQDEVDFDSFMKEFDEDGNRIL